MEKRNNITHNKSIYLQRLPPSTKPSQTTKKRERKIIVDKILQNN